MPDMSEDYSCGWKERNVTKPVRVLYVHTAKELCLQSLRWRWNTTICSLGTRSCRFIPIAFRHVCTDEKSVSITYLNPHERHQITKVDEEGKTVSKHVHDDDNTSSTLLERCWACCDATAASSDELYSGKALQNAPTPSWWTGRYKIDSCSRSKRHSESLPQLCLYCYPNCLKNFIFIYLKPLTEASASELRCSEIMYHALGWRNLHYSREMSL